LNNPTPATAPAAGALFQAGLGAAPLTFGGSTAGSGSTTTLVVFSGAHGLVKGQAFGYNGELRFVETVNDSTTVTVNAPFGTAATSGQALTAAVTYFPADMLPSVTAFDYWDPTNAVDRILAGASVNRLQVRVNGDYHELSFSGPAQDVLDTVSFTAGQGGLGSFPAEPAVTAGTEPPVPGNLGQAWLGEPATMFCTVTAATIEVDNDLDLRTREFGKATPQCTAPGVRRVSAELELFEIDDEATRGLYAAARAETPIQVSFQLGQASGQMLGIYLPQVVPQVPEFDDGDRVLKWRFSDARAQGSVNDEIVAAFG
jgi:hypothetical protein